MLLGRFTSTEIVDENYFVAEMPLNEISDSTIIDIKRQKEIVALNKYEYHDGRTQCKMIIRTPQIYDCIVQVRKLNEQYAAIPGRILEDLDNYVNSYY